VIGISVIFCPSANSDNCSLKFIFLIVPFSLLCHSLLVGMRSDDGWGRTLVLEGLFSVEMSDSLTNPCLQGQLMLTTGTQSKDSCLLGCYAK